MKFSDYKKNNLNNTEKKTTEEQIHKNNIDSDKIEKMMNSYSSYSQEELLDEFFKLSEKKKKDGTLNDNEISNIKNTLSPYLSAEQQKNLDKIINLIR
mgnify:CR=1 FL=1